MLASYLSDRHQRVIIKSNGQDYESEWATVLRGVPQDSILGPELFKLFINDLPQSVNSDNADSIIFADDTIIVVNAVSISELSVELENTLNKVRLWCQQSGLHLNEKKTNILKINPIRNANETMAVKYLGVAFDENFSWKFHIDMLSKKLNSICYQLRQLKRKIDQKTLLLLYYANFYSVMTYGIVLWGSIQYLR